MGMLGALIGAAIDRSDGDSGIKGAVIGAVAARAIAALPTVAVGLVILWAWQRTLSTQLDAPAAPDTSLGN